MISGQVLYYRAMSSALATGFFFALPYCIGNVSLKFIPVALMPSSSSLILYAPEGRNKDLDWLPPALFLKLESSVVWYWG
jgi:hypothetical protein